MLVTAEVSQSVIGPYVVVAVVGLVTHAITADFKFASVMAACVLGVAVLGTAVLHPQTTSLSAQHSLTRLLPQSISNHGVA
jgi:hypothetical protein